MDDVRHYHRFCFSERSGRCQGCLGEVVSFQGGNRMRLRPWAGSLYWACEDSETEHRFIANFNVMAKTRRDAMKMVLDEHWDDRLDSASCYPVFKWEQRGRVLSEVTNAEAIAISNKLGKILQEGNRSITPALYADALRDVEAEFGIGAVILALRQVVGFLQRELDYHVKAEPHIENLLSLADGQDTVLKDAADYLKGLSKPIRWSSQGFDRLRLQPKTESGAVGHKCSLCEEVIAAGEAAVRDGEDFAHLCCSVQQADGDDIDREHGAS